MFSSSFRGSIMAAAWPEFHPGLCHVYLVNTPEPVQQLFHLLALNWAIQAPSVYRTLCEHRCFTILGLKMRIDWKRWMKTFFKGVEHLQSWDEWNLRPGRTSGLPPVCSRVIQWRGTTFRRKPGSMIKGSQRTIEDKNGRNPLLPTER